MDGDNHRLYCNVHVLIPLLHSFSKDSTPEDSSWRTVPLPNTSPGRRRNVTSLRAMGGDPVCVPPDFNSEMTAIWNQLWHSMPQTGQVSLTIKNLLQKYKERCAAERKKNSHTKSPAPLLPVSFGQAKDWVLRQQRAQSIAIQEGIVNDSAREVVLELRQSLTQQPPFAAALLQQPPRTASPVIPPPIMSLGPDQVTSQEKAAEREEQQVEEISTGGSRPIWLKTSSKHEEEENC